MTTVRGFVETAAQWVKGHGRVFGIAPIVLAMAVAMLAALVAPAPVNAATPRPTVVFEGDSVLRIAGYKGVTRNEAARHITELHDGARWGAFSDGSLLFVPPSASGYPEITGTIALKSNAKDEFPFRLYYQKQTNNGTYVAIQMEGSIYEINGTIYADIEEKVGEGSSSRNLTVTSTLNYILILNKV